jgi:hypothetical protein
MMTRENNLSSNILIDHFKNIFTDKRRTSYACQVKILTSDIFKKI